MIGSESYFRAIPTIWAQQGEMPATRCNELTRFVAANQILGVLVVDEGRFHPPWSVRWTAWDSVADIFRVALKRGHVWLSKSGDCPEVGTTGEFGDIEVSVAASHWRLVMGSEIPARFRAVTGADEGESDDVVDDSDDGGTNSPPPDWTRVLRATELVLIIPRTRSVLEVEPDADGVVMFRVSFVSPTDLPRVRAFDRPPNYGTEVLRPTLDDLGATDQGWHEVHLGTLWAISPKAGQTVVDGDWALEYEPRCWWNLGFAERLPPATIQNELLSSAGMEGFAGGVGDGLIRNYMAAINRENALAELALAKLTVESRTWTI